MTGDMTPFWALAGMGVMFAGVGILAYFILKAYHGPGPRE